MSAFARRVMIAPRSVGVARPVYLLGTVITDPATCGEAIDGGVFGRDVLLAGWVEVDVDVFEAFVALCGRLPGVGAAVPTGQDDVVGEGGQQRSGV